MILHTINKSPYSTSTLNDCLRLCSDGDAILFIEDGVYAVQQGAQTTKQYPTITFYALGPDLEARGLNTMQTDIITIDDNAFVELAIKYQKVQSWY
jgi:tRNA 2-thiouridine synthesizing protein B